MISVCDRLEFIQSQIICTMAHDQKWRDWLNLNSLSILFIVYKYFYLKIGAIRFFI